MSSTHISIFLQREGYKAEVVESGQMVWVWLQDSQGTNIVTFHCRDFAQATAIAEAINAAPANNGD